MSVTRRRAALRCDLEALYTNRYSAFVRVGGCSADVEAGVGQHLGRRIGVGLVEVGEHDMLAGADPTRNRLADLPRSDDDSNLAHE
jgi:hypothetical protein